MDQIQWLADMMGLSMGRLRDRTVSDEAVDILRKDFDIILDEWRNKYPGFETSPGTTIDEIEVTRTDDNLVLIEIAYKFIKPKWEVQFSELHPIGQYQGYDLYRHLGFTLAYHEDRKYLVCSEMSAYQTAQEMFLVAKRIQVETDRILDPLASLGI